MEMTARF